MNRALNVHCSVMAKIFIMKQNMSYKVNCWLPSNQDQDDSMPDMFPEDSDSSLTSVGSSVGWTPPQSATG